jgi:hypothetical protein
MRVRRSLRLGIVAVLIAVVSAATACSAVSGLLTTTKELGKAGFKNAKVDYKPGDERTLVVSYTTDATDVESLGAEYADVASVVWHKAPLKFDALQVSARDAPGECTGSCTDRFTSAALAVRYGPRAASLDRDIDKQLLYAGAAALVGIIVVVVTVIALIVRSRRKARATPYPAPGYPGAPPGWAPQGTINDAPDPVRAPAPGYAPPTAANPAPARPAVVNGPPSGGTGPTASVSGTQEPPPPPPPDPTHDIWARPPS